MAGANPPFTKSDEFLLNTGKIWKLIKETNKRAEPLSKAKDDFELADGAMTGDLPAYDSNIEKVRVFVAKQNDKLSELARKDENFWIERSGADLFNQAAMVTESGSHPAAPVQLPARTALTHFFGVFLITPGLNTKRHRRARL